MPRTARFALIAAFALLALTTAPASANGATDLASEGGIAGQVVPVDQLGPIPANVKMTSVPSHVLGLDGSNSVAVRLRCADLPFASCNGTVVIVLPIESIVGGKIRGGGQKQ